MKNKTIKIINLLNKISNGEIVPKHIKYQNEVYTFDTDDLVYYDEDDHDLFWTYNYRILNDTVEILPEGYDEWEDIEEIENIDEFAVGNLTELNSKIINKLIKNQKRIIEKVGR